jgi:FkbM family methyltransferase
MNIQTHKENFRQGKISKHQLVENLYGYHNVLFNFSDQLSNTEIDKIEITDGHVCFVTRETNHHDGGVRFVVTQNDRNATPLTAFNFDVLERDDSEVIFKMVKKGDIVFDIGANVGWYSMHLAKKVDCGHIHSFEPIPPTFHQLEQNMWLNKLENISINNLALTDKPQTLSFYFSPQFSAAASSRNITGLDDVIELKCEASTLDLYVSENNVSRIDFIKCDVEGAEYFVFKGGLHSLQRFKPIVFTEMLRKWAAKFDYHPNDIIKLFSDLNYSCFYSANGQMREITEVSDETIPTNYLFLHNDKHSEIIASL